MVVCPATKNTRFPNPAYTLISFRRQPVRPCTTDSASSFERPGLVTNSILFCWLFRIKDRCKKVRFQQTHNQGLRQLLLTVSRKQKKIELVSRPVLYAQNKVKATIYFLSPLLWEAQWHCWKKRAWEFSHFVFKILVGKTCSGTLLVYDEPLALLEILVVAPCLLS